MTAIPNHFGDGGVGLTTATTPDGSLNLKAVLNGLATDVAAMKGAAPSTITSPLSAAMTGTVGSAVTTTAGSAVTTTVGSALGAYASSASPSALENDADRTRMNELRADLLAMNTLVSALRTDLLAMNELLTAARADIVTLTTRTNSLRTEVVALRATQTTRSGVTLSVTPSADYA